MRRIVRLALVLPLAAALFTLSCQKGAGIPEPGSQPYRDLVSSFYVGLAALQAGEDVRAREGLTRASQIAPGEPAALADLGVLNLRQQQYDEAYKNLNAARVLAPNDSRIQELLGLVESKRGNLPEAIRYLKQSVALDSTNLMALYSLAAETERQGTADANRDARTAIDRILRVQPNNQPALLDLIRLSAKLNDPAAMNRALAALNQSATNWPEPATRQLAAIQTAAAANPRTAAVQVQFLRNLLVRDVNFRRDLDALRPPAGNIGEPFTRFLRLTPPSSQPAPADTALRFDSTATPLASQDVGWAGALVLNATADAQPVWADTKNLHLPAGTLLALPPGTATLNPDSIALGDLNDDFKTDVVMATAKGLRLYQQGLLPLFTDATPQARLPAALTNGTYTGVWLFDYDLDGDLDLVLGVGTGDPVVLRNNGDGTFTPAHPFTGLPGLTAFVATDVDSDGDPDVALADGAGQLHVFLNERLGNFRPVTLSSPAAITSLIAADTNADGQMDWVAATRSGAVVSISWNERTKSFDRAQLVQFTPPPQPARLLAADLDNNGSLDLILGTQFALHDAKGFASPRTIATAAVQALLDTDNRGRLNALAITPARTLATLLNHGSKQYKWQTLRTRAAQTTGDGRINSFGIGGEIEVRSGLLTQKQNITSPITHFGLGENTGVSLARIVWPNGQLQVEFDLKPDSIAAAQQRLKGSCPFLFAWNGKRMEFIKDCAPWSPALGLHVNAQQVAGIGQTEEWFKIPGTQLQPRNRAYDLRITGEYWETFYIDRYAFLAVDHPTGTEVFTDERFAVPAPPLRLYATKTPQSFASAHDDNGHDVRDAVAAIDEHYLDNFGRGRYQGVTRDHWVELELPAKAPTHLPLYLVATGWVHPTDATVNVALGQGAAPPPQSLSVEVATPSGQWKTAESGLGFPAGRRKTIVLDLTKVFLPNAPRRLRLRTNLEIYWDQLAWAEGLPNSTLRTQPLALQSATLGYRGFSRITQANPSSPEIPDYQHVDQRGPRWRDLEGYYTRYGDVKPLLDKADDRLLITNAGDELQLQVTAPAPPPPGWTRDLILIGNGWIKDGDYNCTFSRTVLPLPYRALTTYETPPTSLESDPSYRLHPEDWTTFHTRYIAPELFSGALWR